MTEKTLAIKGAGFCLPCVVFMTLLMAWQFDMPRTCAQGGAPAYRVWPSKPPSGCPFPQSQDITGIGFTGRHNEYTHADTWYPSWASDGDMYSPYADGNLDGVKAWGVEPTVPPNPGTLWKFYPTAPPQAATGQGKITGDDPLNLRVVSLGSSTASAKPYAGRYPAGSLVYNGIWYYGTYVLDDLSGSCGNWCVVGPFVGFRISRDYGKTWIETPRTLTPILGPEMP